MMQAVRLKNGTIGLLKEEWNWKRHPLLKIMTEANGERIYGDFVDVELNGEIKTYRIDNQYLRGPSPFESEFNKVCTTVCRKDVEFVDLF